MVTRYLHLQNEPNLLPGQIVRAGQVIARVGSTGKTGPDSYPCHLHYEERLPDVRWDDGKAKPEPANKYIKEGIPKAPH
ncbi:M23 family metallopeptidase [Acidithiobacillus sp.]